MKGPLVCNVLVVQGGLAFFHPQVAACSHLIRKWFFFVLFLLFSCFSCHAEDNALFWERGGRILSLLWTLWSACVCHNSWNIPEWVHLLIAAGMGPFFNRVILWWGKPILPEQFRSEILSRALQACLLGSPWQNCLRTGWVMTRSCISSAISAHYLQQC